MWSSPVGPTTRFKLLNPAWSASTRYAFLRRSQEYKIHSMEIEAIESMLSIHVLCDFHDCLTTQRHCGGSKQQLHFVPWVDTIWQSISKIPFQLQNLGFALQFDENTSSLFLLLLLAKHVKTIQNLLTILHPRISVNSPPQHTGMQLHCNYTHQISPKSSKFKLTESTCWTCWTYWTHIGRSSLVKPDVLSGWYNNESFLYAFAAQSDVCTAQRSPWPRLSHHLATQLGRPSWFPQGARTRQHPKPANFHFWEHKFWQNRCAIYIYI